MSWVEWRDASSVMLAWMAAMAFLESVRMREVLTTRDENRSVGKCYDGLP